MLGILGPGKACSSLTPDKQTEVRLSNHRNRNQDRNLHRKAKKKDEIGVVVKEIGILPVLVHTRQTNRDTTLKLSNS